MGLHDQTGAIAAPPGPTTLILMLAAAIVPLATAYSIAEGFGEPASVDLDARPFQHFYAAFVGLTVAAVSVVSLPGLPLDSRAYFVS